MKRRILTATKSAYYLCGCLRLSFAISVKDLWGNVLSSRINCRLLSDVTSVDGTSALPKTEVKYMKLSNIWKIHKFHRWRKVFRMHMIFMKHFKNLLYMAKVGPVYVFENKQLVWKYRTDMLARYCFSHFLWELTSKYY